VLAHDALGRLASIKQPLVITGAQHAVIPAENSEVVGEHIPDSRVEVIAGAGHRLFIERLEPALAAVSRFLLEC
jgi:pimeloyl-ACP methyl ester carboxylesterase